MIVGAFNIVANTAEDGEPVHGQPTEAHTHPAATAALANPIP